VIVRLFNINRGLGIAVRHIESILRMSEASAKMSLREYVRSDDIDFAIGVLLDSFIQSQKYTVGKQIKAKFAKYLNKTEDTNSVLLHTLDRLMREQVTSFGC